MRFDLDIEKRLKKVIKKNIKDIKGFDIVEKEVDYMIIKTSGEPTMVDICGIIDELYTDILDLLMVSDVIGICINPSSTNLETLVYDDSILDDVATNLNRQLFNKYGIGNPNKPYR